MLSRREGNELVKQLKFAAPRDTGSLRNSIMYSQPLPNGFVVTVGTRGYTSNAGRTPSEYAWYVNEGINGNERNRDFVKRGYATWARDFLNRHKDEDVSITEEE